MTFTRRRRVLVFLGLLLVVAGATAAIRYLIFPPSRIPSGAIVVPRDAATLDEALRRVQPGGTIVLDASGQAAVGPFVVDKAGITICAIGSSAHITAAGTAPALTVSASGVTLRNLDLTTEGVGVSVTSTDCRLLNLAIRGASTAVRLSGAQDCTLDTVDVRDVGVGLELASSGGVTVRALSVRDASEVGLRAVGSWSCAFERVLVRRARVGISIDGGSRQIAIDACVLESCAEVGVVFRSSNSLTLAGAVIQDTSVGVALDRAANCQVRDCTIERPAAAAIVLEQSLQNRVQGITIRSTGEFGLRLSESSENALIENDILGGPAVAVSLTSSNRNLVMHNDIAAAADGILIADSQSCRVLRNTITCHRFGIVLRGAEDGRVLDNRVTGGTLGVTIVSSAGVAALRNRAVRQTGSAFALVADSPGCMLADNHAAQSSIGIFIAASSASSVLDNVIAENDVGVLLFGQGPGLRLEGNQIERNLVGLRQADPSGVAPAGLEPLNADIRLGTDDVRSPILANNTIRASRSLDIDNQTGEPLYAAGNSWGAGSRSAAAARVSPGVRLQESAWRGTIVLGTETGEVQEILGLLARIVLARAGYHVVDLVGMGTLPLVADAFQAGDIDVAILAPKGTGAPGAGSEQTAFLLSARAGWVAVVSQAIADRLPERSLSALAAALRDGGQSILLTVPRAYGESGVAAFRSAYGLDAQVRAVVWAKTLDEAQSILTFGAAEFAILESLEETVTGSGFVRLEDDLHVLSSESLTALVRTDALATSPGVGEVLSRLAPRLTTQALQGLLSRVRLSSRSPEDMATEFLAQNGLLDE